MEMPEIGAPPKVQKPATFLTCSGVASQNITMPKNPKRGSFSIEKAFSQVKKNEKGVVTYLSAGAHEVDMREEHERAGYEASDVLFGRELQRLSDESTKQQGQLFSTKLTWRQGWSIVCFLSNKTNSF